MCFVKEFGLWAQQTDLSSAVTAAEVRGVTLQINLLLRLSICRVRKKEHLHQHARVNTAFWGDGGGGVFISLLAFFAVFFNFLSSTIICR